MRGKTPVSRDELHLSEKHSALEFPIIAGKRLHTNCIEAGNIQSTKHRQLKPRKCSKHQAPPATTTECAVGLNAFSFLLIALDMKLALDLNATVSRKHPNNSNHWR